MYKASDGVFLSEENNAIKYSIINDLPREDIVEGCEGETDDSEEEMFNIPDVFYAVIATDEPEPKDAFEDEDYAQDFIERKINKAAKQYEDNNCYGQNQSIKVAACDNDYDIHEIDYNNELWKDCYELWKKHDDVEDW